MKNNRGTTLIEIALSIGLISIVLIFLMNLFLNVRNTYNQSKIQADYNTIVSTITNAIGSDIEEYGVKSVSYISGIDNNGGILITYNDYRPTKLSENIQKVLSVKRDGNNYSISYAYNSSYTENITSSERVTNVVRTLPEDSVLNTSNLIKLEFLGDTAVKIKIPLSDEQGNIYDINIYGLLPEKFTITFNANGGSVSTSSKVVTYRSTYGDLPTPTRSGYTFLGWFSDAYKDHPLYFYVDSYSDLKNAFGYNEASLYNHWLTYGQSEGRRVSQYLPTDTVTTVGNQTFFAGWYK